MRQPDTPVLTLHDGDMVVRVSRQGGAVVDAAWAGLPFLRPYGGGAASFPLVPFGNRIAGNQFTFAGHDYRLRANTERDVLHLHGDGWLAEWQVVAAAPSSISLDLVHAPAEGTPFSYRASQRISVGADVLTLELAVENTGARAMPFGLGHHPYLPLTPQTTLLARATHYWTEKPGFLPDRLEARPTDLDFDTPRTLPRHWVNNGFEGWDGCATIAWPERGLALDIDAAPPFRRYFLFVSDASFDPAYRGDFFCFEPMTHAADGHNRADLGGLAVLAPGARLDTRVRFMPRRLTP